MAINFDYSFIPQDADIESATLSLYLAEVVIEDSLNPTCSLYTISKPWIENEITWLNATKKMTWENTDTACGYIGGGDYYPEAISVVQSKGVGYWVDFDVTKTIRTLQHPLLVAFNGFMIKEQLNGTTTATSEGCTFFSSENPNTALRPRLVVISKKTSAISMDSFKKKDPRFSPTVKNSHLYISNSFSVEALVSIFTTSGRLIRSFPLKPNSINSEIPAHEFGKGVFLVSCSSIDQSINGSASQWAKLTVD